MHILIVSQYFWPENFRINDIAAGLHDRGHRVTILTGHPNYPEGRFFKGYSGKSVIRETFQGINVIRVPILPRGRGGNLALILNYISFALSGSLLAPLLVSEQFDIIFFNGLSPTIAGFPAIVLKKMHRIHLITYIQDLWPESLIAIKPEAGQTAISALRMLVKIIYRNSTEIWVSSRAFIPKIRETNNLSVKLHYFPQYGESFYLTEAKNVDWPEENDILEGFTILFAGNIGTAQDLVNVLMAAEHTQSHGIQWVFVGAGSAKKDLIDLANRKALKNVHFLGSYPAQQMPEFFARADALLVSLADQELFSLTVPAKIQSYLASGKPILASLKGEGAEVIRESKAGLVVEPENPMALAKSAIELKELGASRRIEMGENGRRYFEKHFEREARIDELENAFFSLSSSCRHDGSPKTMHRFSYQQRSYLFFLPIVEKVLALAATGMLAPLLLALAVLIRLDSRGPALFVQERAGRYHRPFKIYKFRTMRVDTPHLSTEEMQQSGLKPITRVGAFLRRTSLDELPQLFNVLKGEMSLIGPRPALMSQTRVLQLREQAGVDQLKPGMTGYAQVTGRDDLDDEEKVRRDAYYLRHLGVGLDLKVLLLTFSSVFQGTGNK